MAAIPIYIVGTITTAAPKGGEVSGSGIEQCVISGLASIEGLTIGGGPIIPPTEGGKPPWEGVGKPPVIEHPIWPGFRPGHPIVLPPDKPTDPPTEPPTSPADPTWVWGWNRSEGWHPVYVPPEGAQTPH